jgi:Protein of unknown function (DUF3617)
MVDILGGILAPRIPGRIAPMMLRLTAVAATAAFALAAHAADNPFEAFKGKVKPGLYEYKVDSDMGSVPGMPAGMGKQSHTMQHCVTAEDVQKGEMGGGRNGKGMRDSCQAEDMHVSGNTATYKVVCKGGQGDMSMDSKIAFKSDGYTMDNTMEMADRGRGAPMHMKQHIESRYLGPCSGR